MKTIIFNGREYAHKKELQLKEQLTQLKNQGLYPKMVSIIIGEDPASLLYVNLKKKAAERLGAELVVVNLASTGQIEEIKNVIENYNNDPQIHGIMIQLPLPEGVKKYTHELIEMIDPTKDVDGLKEKSQYIHPTSLAVVEILKTAIPNIDEVKSNLSIVVVGASGMVGKPLMDYFEKNQFMTKGVTSETDNLRGILIDADVVISATGVPNLIEQSMLKDEVVIIDVGSPLGDFNQNVSTKAKFFTPVPGGVGPVTITCLMQNLLAATQKKLLK